MEGDVVTMQDLIVFEVTGEDSDGGVVGHHRVTGLRPAFWDRAKYFGYEKVLSEALSVTDA